MEFKNPQIGILKKRYKRFFIDIELPNGAIITAHCCNTGAMTGLLTPNALCMFSVINSKLGYQWQMVFADNTWVGVNTIAANNIFREFFLNNNLFIKNPDTIVKAEYNLKKINGDNHRIDFFVDNCLLDPSNSPSYCNWSNYQPGKPFLIEVKHVQWKVDGQLIFPDTPTERGASQVKSLIKLTQDYNILLVFMAQRNDSNVLKIAKHIDPVLFGAVGSLMENGGMVMAIGCQCVDNIITPNKILEYIHN
jgi:sugar fermentation stimulation protein A